MGIQAVWDNEEKTIIRHVYNGKWTLEDYYHLIADHGAMVTPLGHTVDIINDLREAGPIPPGMATAIKYAARKAPANEGINVIVGANQFVKALIELVNKVAGTEVTEVTHVATLEEAYAIIAEHRGNTTPA
jgi:hypothetical protein